MKFLLFFALMGLLSQSKKDRRGSDLFKGVVGFYVVSLVLSFISRFPFIPLAIVGVIAAAALMLSQKMGEQQETRKPGGTTYRSENWDKENRNPYSRTYSGASEKTTGGRAEEGKSAGSTSSGSFGQAERSAGHMTTEQQKVRSRILPRPVTKRTKIVNSFNEKFRLTLTEEEVDRIVTASYMSENWKKEVEAMTEKYETVYEWLSGGHSWLRTYIYAFEVQNISSDFEMQEKMVQEAFQEVFHYAEGLSYLSRTEKIARVNDRFFTVFDEATFMMAYRYMEKKGFTYNLGTEDVLKNEDEAEKAMRRYGGH